MRALRFPTILHPLLLYNYTWTPPLQVIIFCFSNEYNSSIGVYHGVVLVLTCASHSFSGTVLLRPSTWLLSLATAISVDSTPVLSQHANSLEVLDTQLGKKPAMHLLRNEFDSKCRFICILTHILALLYYNRLGRDRCRKVVIWCLSREIWQGSVYYESVRKKEVCNIIDLRGTWHL